MVEKPGGMTIDQAISVLAKAEVEQRTLQGLWAQFSVAIQQVGEVLGLYQMIKKELPGLEKRKEDLETAIVFLTTDHGKRKEELRVSTDLYRKSLEAEIGPLETQLNEGRERVIAINGAARDAERQANLRLQEIEERTANAKDRLASIEESLAAIARQVAR